MISRISAVAVVVAIAVSSAVAAEPSLIGVWQLDDAQSGLAGLYIFTPTHYSMMAAAKGRKDLADTSKATADELQAMWGPMLANTGTYEISGDLITIHPVAAKFPVVMKPGNTEVYRFHVEGNTLTLQQVRNARGIAIESGAVRRLVRVE
ncbi:MAG TPA: lipocalin-like domain-containing protein [Bryobacteraceae bacterium]|nr:lipocalin-like domain-containing protein [Bryobacteraceae bacterium]